MEESVEEHCDRDNQVTGPCYFNDVETLCKGPHFSVTHTHAKQSVSWKKEVRLELLFSFHFSFLEFMLKCGAPNLGFSEPLSEEKVFSFTVLQPPIEHRADILRKLGLSAVHPLPKKITGLDQNRRKR